MTLCSKCQISLVKISSFFVAFLNRKHELYYGASSRIVFVCILGELKTPKRHFEINSPLVDRLAVVNNFALIKKFNITKFDCTMQYGLFE